MAEILIPKALSSVHMIPEGVAAHVGPNAIFPEKGWHREGYPRTETPVSYFQKVEVGDLLTLQLDANTDRPVALELYASALGNLFFYTAPAPVAVPGNTYTDISGNTHQLYTHTAVFTPSAIANLKSGIYWLRVKFEWDHDGDGTVDAVQYAVSEPLLIRPRHENTVLIDCRHDENDEHFIWLGDEKIVSFRVDGKLSEGTPSAMDASYEDSLMDAALLSSYPYRMWNLETDFIPGYLRLKLHYALGCKYFMAERRGLTKGGGSGLEVGEGNNLLRTAKAALRETDAANNWVTEFAGPGVLGAAIPVFQKAYGYPYLVYDAQMEVDGTIVRLTSAHVVENEAGAADLARQFNSARVLNKRFFGRFAAATFSGKSGICYFPHPLETSTFSKVQGEVLSRSVSVNTQQDTTALTTLSIATRCVLMAVQWDVGGSVVIVGASGGPVTNQSLTNNFPAAPGYGKPKVFQTRIFYREGAGLDLPELVLAGNKTVGIGGKAPATLQTFICSSDELRVFDCDVLSPALGSLDTLTVNSNQLSHLDNYAKPWALLKNIDLRGGALDSASVDAIINTTSANVNAITNPLTGGSLLLRLQNPPAPATGDSTAARTDLTDNYSWTVQTD